MLSNGNLEKKKIPFMYLDL